jgi:phosphate transport system permease protein
VGGDDAAARLRRVSTTAVPARLPGARRFADRIGDRVLLGLAAGASILAVAIIGLIIYEIVNSASPAISKYGLGFFGHQTWNNYTVFGAATLIFGTVVTSAGALLIAAPLGIAIGLYLSLFSARRTAAIIGPLVEMLAAVPSVIIGLWGIIVLGPFLRSTIEPWLHDALGFIPLFGTPSATGSGVFTAIIVLGIMALPIIAAITRDLFLTVPSELKDGALALGATRWEMVRGVVLSSMRPGIASACILGVSRALGEAIAALQVIGSVFQISSNLFAPGNTLGATIAIQANADNSKLQVASLFYLALVLLAIELLVNLAAQAIVRHYRVPSASGPTIVAAGAPN